MNVLGVLQFREMSTSAINLLREFQRSHSEVRVTFSAGLSIATIEWRSFDSFSQLSRLAAAVQTCDRNNREGSGKARPQDFESGIRSSRS